MQMRNKYGLSENSWTVGTAAALPGRLRLLCSEPSKSNFNPPPLPSVKATPPSSSQLLATSKSKGGTRPVSGGTN